MRKRWVPIVIVWVVAATFTLVAAWSHLSESAFPLRGFRELSSPLVGGPVAFASWLLGVFLSVPFVPWRDRLLVGIGYSVCLGLAASVVAGFAPGLLLIVAAQAMGAAIKALDFAATREADASHEGNPRYPVS